MREADVKEALVLDEEADPDVIAVVLAAGYGNNLNEDEVELLGRDPFLISYALADPPNRTVVTFEVAAPNQRRGKRKIPDACAPFSIGCCNLTDLIHVLDFTTDWHP